MNRTLKQGLICATLFLLGVLFGFVLGNNHENRTTEFNIVLLRLNAADAKNKKEPSIQDLLDIWTALGSVDRDINGIITNRGIIYQLGEGLLVEKYKTGRLAPVLRGILEEKQMTVVQYFQLEDALAPYCENWNSLSGVSSFKQKVEIRTPLMPILEKAFPVKPLNITEKDLDAAKPEALLLLKNTYGSLSDFDDSVFFDLVKQASSKK